MSVDPAMPPALFEVEPVRREPVYTQSGDPFVPWPEQRCGFCRRKLRNCSMTHDCGSGTAKGWYWVCDDCAVDDVTANGRSRWGLTREYLELERTRRRIYAAGGGETEVHAALVAAGLVKEPTDA